jgi:putative membrane protein
VVVPALVVIVATAGLIWRYGSSGLLALVVLPVIVWRARQWARHAAYAESPSIIATRTGWLSREWQFAEIGKLQTLSLTASPFDRRHGMATLWLDTAGASSRDGVLRIPYLPVDVASALFDRLAGQMDADGRVRSEHEPEGEPA